MKTIYELSDKHIGQLHQLYQNEWWSKARTLEDSRKCVANSQLCVALVDSQDNLAGFARVLTDFTFKALIFDVIVCENQRGKGLGGKLIGLIKSHEKLSAVTHFELYCLPGMNDFYAKYGFTTEVGSIQLMRCDNA
ncbi:hypothetical protein FGKAn22_07050 [Ferrigenium kumadai]|uniref:N-acetyltransferase domain-containing protein n=1 Tax=Ferrigenium kumadai TaxID=1682490 RepID=A0AAN1SY19_9PROT|nr:GNAT family N-acetyltransferase [Ferrigenium kumadai]BBI99012.1 hypothetical protein FGKAn22_07050 [Ferrigenium kumadai]